MKEKFPMPAEDRNQMHATDPNTGKNKLTEETRPACVYSLETLMALQKMLENGIPSPGERLPRSTPRSSPAESNAQSGMRPLCVQTIREPRIALKEYLRRMWMKLKGSKEADKGHSAQQNG